MEQEAQWQQALDGYEHVLRAAEGDPHANEQHRVCARRLRHLLREQLRGRHAEEVRAFLHAKT